MSYYGGAEALDHLDELTKLYLEVYAEPPYNSGPLWQEESFLDRTRRQTARAGFFLAAARLPSNELVGFSFGLTFAADQWWAGSTDKPPNEIYFAPKFAVIELIVGKPFRNRGVGRRLHDALLARRTEPYATLTALPGASARDLYRRWGWTQVGTISYPLMSSPSFDVLVLPLGDHISSAG